MNEKGEYFFNKEKVTAVQLPFRLQNYKNATKDPRVVLNSAAAADFKNVVVLLDEDSAFVHLGEGYLRNPFEVQNGYIEVPTGPGLGIEIDEEFLTNNTLGPLPDPGRWFHDDDGSVADW